MNRRGFGSLAIMLTVVTALVIAVFWYYEAHQSIPSQPPNNIGQSGSTSTSALNTESSSVITTSTTGTPISLTSASTTTSTVSAASTSSWRTYVDPQDGFSFQYPSDWPLESSTVDQIDFNTSSLGLSDIFVYHKGPNQSLVDFWRGETSSTWIIASATSMTVGGYMALNVEEKDIPGYQSESGGWSDLLLTKDNRLVVDFSPSPLDALVQDGDTIPETILNSFRF
jgi:hypothetical protein